MSGEWSNFLECSSVDPKTRLDEIIFNGLRLIHGLIEYLLKNRVREHACILTAKWWLALKTAGVGFFYGRKGYGSR